MDEGENFYHSGGGGLKNERFRYLWRQAGWIVLWSCATSSILETNVMDVRASGGSFPSVLERIVVGVRGARLR